MTFFVPVIENCVEQDLNITNPHITNTSVYTTKKHTNDSRVEPPVTAPSEIRSLLYYGHFLLAAWQKPPYLPRTQTSLFWWKCARKGRREGDNGRDGASPVVSTLPMVPCGSSPVTRSALASAMQKRSAWGGGCGYHVNTANLFRPICGRINGVPL